MSKKVALLVTAEVQTRVAVKVADDFDVENISEGDFCYISQISKERLAQNLCNGIYDCVTEIKLDTEVPYNENEE